MLKALQTLPQRLSRITSGGKLIREIDGLRFMAIMPVLIQHFSERFERNTAIDFINPPGDNNMVSFLAARGFLGVYIFFVISGFVLALPFASNKLKNSKTVKLKQYYWRRITRLEPTYIIWMSVFFIIFVIHGHKLFSESLPDYLASITYTHGLLYHVWSPTNPPTWTLEIEVQFYMAAPFLACLFFSVNDKIKRRTLNVLCIILLMILQQYFKFYTNPYNLTILGHLHYFLIGFMLADIYLCDWQEIKENTFFDLIAVLAFITMIFTWSWNFEFIRRIFFALSLFIFFFAVFKSHHVKRFVCNPWITAIGGMCYTIYLIHLPFAEFLITFTKNIHVTDYFGVNLLIQQILFLPVILALSAIFFLLFEKPFMNKNWPTLLANKIKRSFTGTKSFTLGLMKLK